jgi:hypothetical protein
MRLRDSVFVVPPTIPLPARVVIDEVDLIGIRQPVHARVKPRQAGLDLGEDKRPRRAVDVFAPFESQAGSRAP